MVGALAKPSLRILDLLVCAPFPALMMQAALRIAKTQNENILNIWVPGQYADGMSTTELTNAIRYCDVLIGNAHEIAYIRKMLPEGFGQKTVIETDGPRPVRAMLSDGSQRMPIPAVSPIVDPTGCGDAFGYRARAAQGQGRGRRRRMGNEYERHSSRRYRASRPMPEPSRLSNLRIRVSLNQ